MVAVLVAVSVAVLVAVAVSVAVGVGVSVLVDVAVLVGDGIPTWLSTDPLSQLAPNGRPNPRWSSVTVVPQPLVPLGIVSKTG